MSRKVSFRGMIDSSLGNDAQDTVHLHTIRGAVGYKITKMQVFPNEPGAVTTEGVVKIFKIKQTAIDALVNFEDQTLLAAAYYTQYTGANTTANTLISIFDNVFIKHLLMNPRYRPPGSVFGNLSIICCVFGLLLQCFSSIVAFLMI